MTPDQPTTESVISSLAPTGGAVEGASLVSEMKTSPPPWPPTGFGVGVNNYLNHYVGIADAKAAGFTAAALTVGAALLGVTPDPSKGEIARVLHALALTLLAGAVSTGAAVIFPRLPSGNSRGLIFWEDIRIWPKAADYERALSQASERDVEFEYAAQNYVVSKVLHDKHVLVRWTICLFLAGTGTAAAAAYRMMGHA